MLSINTIARVDVNVQRYAAQPASFDTGLLLVKDSSFTAEKRLKSYANSAEAAAGLIADGFADSSEAYKAAQNYFSASPSPGRLLVSCCPESESAVQALDAVLERTSDFYGVALADTQHINFHQYRIVCKGSLVPILHSFIRSLVVPLFMINRQ